MLSFLLIAALFMMLVPALLSLVFASANPAVILWNFGWYALMGYMAALALESPVGFTLCFFFCFSYVIRIVSAPKRAPGTMFRNANIWVSPNLRRQKNASPFQQAEVEDDEEIKPRRRAHSSNEDVVIDAEFRREDGPQN